MCQKKNKKGKANDKKLLLRYSVNKKELTCGKFPGKNDMCTYKRNKKSTCFDFY